VSPVRYELDLYIPEDGILHCHRRENLKSYLLHLVCLEPDNLYNFLAIWFVNCYLKECSIFTVSMGFTSLSQKTEAFMSCVC
jgi:hypothetical protein